MNGIDDCLVIGIDTNIFIYQFEDNPEFSGLTTALFTHITQKRKRSVTSILSLIETLSYPAPQDVLDGIENSFRTIPKLTIVDVDFTIAREAARIRRFYLYRLPDAVQLATCLLHKGDVFITNDERLKAFPEIPVVLLSNLDK